MSQDLSRKQAVAMLWHRGVLTWKLDAVQHELYKCYTDSTYKTVVWSCSRRLGKSYALCVVAIEQCLKKANSTVKFIAPTAKHVKMIIKPLFREILKDCPKELRPEFRTADNVFRFPNGSEVQLAGTDNGHAEALRGGSSDLCVVDEAGFCDDLRYLVQSILIPTTTTTKGKIILSSTPPKSPDHDFVHYIKEAEYRGTFVKKTIYDNKRLTPDVIQDIVDELGGEESPEFRREYLCELIVDEEHSVVPEFNERMEKELVQEWPTPPFRDLYVAGDIGFKDLTVFLFAYYDFKKDKLVIEDELVMSGKKMTTQYMAEELKRKEAALWTHPMTSEQQTPYLRVCDNNLIVINDLQRLHGLNFIPTQKDDAQAALNNMRIMIAQKRIIINPRCKTLIYHLKNATWAKNRKTFDRSPDAGHYDAVDALKYLVRNVYYSRNPYPANWGHGTGDNWFDPKTNSPLSNPSINAFKDIFKIKKQRY